jgi:hypothetical protein
VAEYIVKADRVSWSRGSAVRGEVTSEIPRESLGWLLSSGCIVKVEPKPEPKSARKAPKAAKAPAAPLQDDEVTP